MYTILNLFGRSPFAPLQVHMDKVGICVHMLRELFEAIDRKEWEEAEAIAQRISEHEHLADLAKNDIRNHLPKTLYLPIDRSELLEILSIQDSIANFAEDVAVLTTLRPLTIPKEFHDKFKSFLEKNIESYDVASAIIHEMHELVESSFGGHEAEKVNEMINQVAYKEHEADLIQRLLLKDLLQAENQITYSNFYLWQKIFESISSISNLSEKLANRVRMTLALK
jgi:predicted phosphate transport protein (TIGR00153 family)